MNFDLPPIDLPDTVKFWALSCLGFLIAVGIVSFVVMLFVHGTRGPRAFFQGIIDGLNNLVSLSPRRLGALTMLTYKEAIRRKALLVFVVFAVLFMFAGWFLTGGVEQQKEFLPKIYISFALRAITWLLLPMVLILSCWGIPEDIKQRSLHTVVTKPARRLEVVLGRMMGFGLIGSVILAVMGTVGYIWIVRQVPRSQYSQLTCRQPVYGQLNFLDRQGLPGPGLNVGDLSMFRSFIEGASKGRAIYTFENVDASVLHSNGSLQLESRFEAFRTHKGDMKRTIYYQYTLVNPDNPEIKVPLSVIQIDKEFVSKVSYVALSPAIQLVDETGKPLSTVAPSKEAQRDFFKDVVSNGKLIVQVACIDPGQFVGMSRVDLFFRKPDKPFWVGYAKSLLGIEFLLLLVVMLGVTSSTFVKGPVASFLTACLIILGMFGQGFMNEILLPAGVEVNTSTGVLRGAEGGGVFESIYRMITHLNPLTELPSGPAFVIMQYVDWVLELFVWSIRYYIPNCEHFSRMPEYVANGFDVQWMESLLPSMLVTIGFFFPCLFVGYYSLQSRELESK